jgi:formylglycine-generating enzyme required for sulfatase activity/predicted Ser/Thr protein kinase
VTDGDDFDSASDAALLRRIAHAPPRRPPSAAIPGTKWSESGRYVIERLLGRGGMGTVYAATDTMLSRKVALKVLDAADLDDNGARLLREAQLAAAVEHERIARVYDVGRHEGFTFVAMEYVQGGTLREAMSARRFAVAEVIDLAIQIAEGLAELHTKRVIHRDLKPENVMLTTAGSVKLLDFGLARHADSAAAAIASGTPGYMAPEQWKGDSADERADIFSLGVIVYEMVTGERLFGGKSTEEIARAIQELTPSLDSPRWNDFPAGFKRDVATMLARDPAARFADGRAVLTALRNYAATSTNLPAATVQQPRRLGKRVVVAGGILLVAGAVGVYAATRPTRAEPRPAPPDMVRIDVGKIEVGRGFIEVLHDCGAIGKSCYLPQMLDEVPRTSVTVEPFFIDRDEVTNPAFVEFLEHSRGTLVVAPDDDHHYPRYVHRNGEHELLADLSPKHGGIEYVEVGDHHEFRVRAGHEHLPAVQMSWFGAKLYCESRGKRLPDENEWEAAARGANDRPFPWGTDLPKCGQVTIPNDGEALMSPGCPTQLEVSVRAVGSSPQDVSPDGVRDLGGNVAEWTASQFVEGDRGARALPGDTPRVIRGGSWLTALAVRTSGRNRRPPTIMAPNVGFRCATSESEL